MKKIKIVKFEDGKYGIRKKGRFLLITWFEFLSQYSEKWYCSKDNIDDFCKYGSYEVASNRLDKFLREPDYGTPVDKLR